MALSALVGNVQNFNMVNIQQVSPAGPTVSLHLSGDDAYAGGMPQWDISNRPRRRSVISYVGQDLHTIDLPLTIDGFGTGPRGEDVSVEDTCGVIEAWADPVPGLTPARTPALRIASTVVRQPRYIPWWVVTKIDWTPGQIRLNGGRVQQQIVLSLTEYLAPTFLLGPAARARAAAGL